VLLVEILLRRRLVPTLREFRARTRIFGDEEAARDEVRAGRGGFLLTAHFGSWETAGTYLAYERVPFTGIARPVPNPYVQRFLMKTRREAYSVFEKTGAVDQSLRVIRRGGWVAVLGDQNAGRHGVFIPFFGVPASTYRSGRRRDVRLTVTSRGDPPRPRLPLRLHLRRPRADHDGRRLHLLETYHVDRGDGRVGARAVPRMHCCWHPAHRRGPGRTSRVRPRASPRGAPRPCGGASAR
jgi:hypothetical protein